MVFKLGEVNHKPETNWLSGEGRSYSRTLSPVLANALDLRTKKGREFSLLCERLAMDAELLKAVKLIVEKNNP